MRWLMDTNIFISLEGNEVLNESFADLARLAHGNGHFLMVHPASEEDIRRDSNPQRMAINLSKIKKYTVLESPPILSPEEEARLGLSAGTPNARVDNQILHAVAQDAVNILITEDRGIHAKARLLKVSDRVHYLQQAVGFLRRMHAGAALALPPMIRTIPLHNIDGSVPFFNSLRESYPGFDNWYRRSAQQGRKAWIVSHDSGAFGAVAPRALVIYKEESNPRFNNRDIPGNGLKLCTFKVGEDVRGIKLGELFLKTAMEYAGRMGHAFIFITMRQGNLEHNHLEDLCVDFGFEKFDTCNGDNVFVKKQPPAPPPRGGLGAFEYHRTHCPFFFAGEEVGKFMVPIQPQYHDILFPDAPEAQPQIPMGVHPEESSGNAIKKAYLCRAQIRQVKPGDVLLFYRSVDRKKVTTVGVVEKAEILAGCDKIMSMVSKRTVYSYEEVAKAFGEEKTLVLLFRVACHLKKDGITFERLKEIGAVSGTIQSVQNIPHEKFLNIAHETQISDRFCVG